MRTIDYRRLTPEQIAQIEFIHCYDADDVTLTPDISTQLCDAGCGTLIAFKVGVPLQPNKVCGKCTVWLMNCEGNA